MSETGVLKVSGFAFAKNDDVVYSELLLQREEMRGSKADRRKEWVTVYRHTTRSPFYLLTPEGVCQVEPGISEFECRNPQIRLWSEIKRKDQEVLLARMEDLHVPGFPPKSGFLGTFAYTYRIIQHEIKSRSPITVQGEFVTAEGHPEIVSEPEYVLFSQKTFKTESEGLPILGSFQSTETTKLLFVDDQEPDLFSKLKGKPLMKLTAAVAIFAIIVAVSAFFAMGSHQSENSSPARATASVASENPRELVPKLHDSCLKGNVEACQSLYERRQEFRLNAFYTNFYKKSACKYGANQYCDLSEEP